MTSVHLWIILFGLRTANTRMLVGKAFQHDFHWPTAIQDAVELVKTCRACYFHAKQIYTPAQTL
jgi:hypothetical protein